MPQAKTVEKRVAQILAYLESKYAAGYPVELKWRKILIDPDEPVKCRKEYAAETYLESGKIIILMSRKRNRTYDYAIDTIIHEYAHARDWRHARIEGREDRKIHGPEWALYYGEMYTDIHDEDGWKLSREF